MSPAGPTDRSRAPGAPGDEAPGGGPGDPRSDAELLRAHVDGDHDAFGELFARHRDRLWAVALRTMGNREDAADGLQDGLVAAYRRAGSFRGDAAVTTWLHRVVVNACLDRLRAAKVRRAEPLPDDLDHHAGRGTTATTDAAPDPADVSVAAERRRAVLDALATLPDEQRAALVLVDMEGYPVAEVATMLGCASGTVKSRCSRGRARLLVLLGDLAERGDPEHADPGNPGPTPAVRSSTSPRAPPPRRTAPPSGA
jgi:RNA polymerase sigma-70 factor, ECF subfamily